MCEEYPNRESDGVDVGETGGVVGPHTGNRNIAYEGSPEWRPVTLNRCVLGDSVPHGERTSATGWPHRVDGVSTVAVHGGRGVSLASLASDVTSGELAIATKNGRESDHVGVVHAGHNDAQLSGGEPRVTEPEFVEAARLDAFLDSHQGVDRHAFVGLVPLLRLDRPESVPFDESQSARSLAYDEALAEVAEAVDTHLTEARPVEA